MTEIERIRYNKIKELEDLGFSGYDKCPTLNFKSKSFEEKYANLTKENIEENCFNDQISIAGRIMAKREQGKATFLVVQDGVGRFQVYARQDELSENEFKMINLADIGDFLYFFGRPMKTKTGEVTLRLQKTTFLTKSLKPLPEKYHGLKDIEEIYRHRHIDLIVNEHSKEKFIKRAKILNNIRQFLQSKGFLEVETPILTSACSGAAAKPFQTHHNSLNRDLFLRIATETSLKKLLVGGIEKVFELGKNFRNEGISPRHNPEFTAIEIYESYGNVNTVMKLSKELIISAAREIKSDLTFNIKGKTISLNEEDWSEITMEEAVYKYSNVDFTKIKTLEQAIEAAKQHNVKFEKFHDKKNHILVLFFEKFVEPNLTNPTMITKYPVEISPFSYPMKDEPDFTERFELFINGQELANGFTELTDPIDQESRLEEQVRQKEAGSDEIASPDKEFVEALKSGMPPAGGVGVGIDRLIILLTESESIKDVLLFPQLRDNPNE